MTDWFMQKPYNDKISNVSFKFLYPLAPFDEYIPNDYYFSLFLLPGQGKILKLEYLYSYREDENEGPIKGPPHMLSMISQRATNFAGFLVIYIKSSDVQGFNEVSRGGFV